MVARDSPPAPHVARACWRAVDPQHLPLGAGPGGTARPRERAVSQCRRRDPRAGGAKSPLFPAASSAYTYRWNAETGTLERIDDSVSPFFLTERGQTLGARAAERRRHLRILQ